MFFCYYASSTRPIDTRSDLSYEITLEVLFEILAIEAERQNSREKMLLWTNFRQNSIVSRYALISYDKKFCHIDTFLRRFLRIASFD